LDKLGWSTQAHKVHKAAVSAQASHAAARRRMQKGPYIVDDGILVIPSEWYNEEAKDFWKSIGCRWNEENRSWDRDTVRPHKGRTYSPEAWLKSVRGKFYESWPELAEGRGDGHATVDGGGRGQPARDENPLCVRCGRPLEAGAPGTVCAGCRAERRRVRERYFGNWR
jgi:hypothetical protein